MVVREYAECTVCDTRFVLRVGVSIEDSCTHTFDCPTCHIPISIEARTGPPPIAWIEVTENAKAIPEDKGIDVYVNLHPAFALAPDEFGDQYAFPSMRYLTMIQPFIRAPSNARTRDMATEFEVPNTQQVWPLVRNILNLASKGDPASVLQQQITRYTKTRQKHKPEFQCSTIFKSVASFFDDIFYPAIGKLRNPLKVLITDQRQTHPAESQRFEDFYRAEFEQTSIERYLSIFNDYFRHFDQFRQMLVHARIADEHVDDLVVGAKRFDEIKLYYGQAYETLTSSYVTLACINNIEQGRKFDEFQAMTLTKYMKDVEKAKRANPFKGVPELDAFTTFENSALRNGSHHASIWHVAELVKFRSGGTGAEREISYSRYMHQCNGITIALAALFLVEMQMFSTLRPV